LIKKKTEVHKVFHFLVMVLRSLPFHPFLTLYSRHSDYEGRPPSGDQLKKIALHTHTHK